MLAAPVIVRVERVGRGDGAEDRVDVATDRGKSGIEVAWSSPASSSPSSVSSHCAGNALSVSIVAALAARPRISSTAATRSAAAVSSGGVVVVTAAVGETAPAAAGAHPAAERDHEARPRQGRPAGWWRPSARSAGRVEFEHLEALGQARESDGVVQGERGRVVDRRVDDAVASVALVHPLQRRLGEGPAMAVALLARGDRETLEVAVVGAGPGDGEGDQLAPQRAGPPEPTEGAVGGRGAPISSISAASWPQCSPNAARSTEEAARWWRRRSAAVLTSST